MSDFCYGKQNFRFGNLEKFPAKAQSSLSSEEKQRTKDEGQKAKSLAFCALGNPNNFFEQLRQDNFDLIGTQTFSDHHFYTQNDVNKIEKKARESGAEILLTTAKDAVKLKDLQFELPCFIVESEMIFDDERGFRDLLRNMAEARASARAQSICALADARASVFYSVQSPASFQLQTNKFGANSLVCTLTFLQTKELP